MHPRRLNGLAPTGPALNRCRRRSLRAARHLPRSVPATKQRCQIERWHVTLGCERHVRAGEAVFPGTEHRGDDADRVGQLVGLRRRERLQPAPAFVSADLIVVLEVAAVERVRSPVHDWRASVRDEHEPEDER